MQEEITRGEDGKRSNITIVELEKWINHYVSLERELISENSTDGFPIALSTQIVQLISIWDFHIDGYKFFPVTDISEVKRGKTERLFQEIMEKEGYFQDSSSLVQEDLTSWGTVFSYFQKKQYIIIVENEKNGDFYIGKVHSSDDHGCVMSCFDVLGVWDEETSEIKYDDITCLTFGDRYSEMMTKYVIE